MSRAGGRGGAREEGGASGGLAATEGYGKETNRSGKFYWRKSVFFSFFISLMDWPDPPLDWIYPLMKPVYIFFVDSRIEIRTK